MPQKSIGLIEFKGLTGAVAAADAAAKAADIDLAACEVTTGACVMLRIEGELFAVQQAIEAATTVARKMGQFLTAKVIPRPHEGLAPLLAPRGYRNRLLQPGPGPVSAPKPRPEIRTAGKTQATQSQAPEKQPRSEPIAAAKPKPAAVPVVAQPTPKPQPPPPKPVVTAGPSATTAADKPDIAALEKLPVVKLRKLARTIANLPIQGREISMANKMQLLEAIRSTLVN
jgi:microcompartment protein CcmL/EutN